jgi:hypothetical protein
LHPQNKQFLKTDEKTIFFARKKIEKKLKKFEIKFGSSKKALTFAPPIKWVALEKAKRSLKVWK